MAARFRALFIAITSLLIVFSLTRRFALYRRQNGPKLTIYWGQNSRLVESSLLETCYGGVYGYLIISSLSTFGNGKEPLLDLSDHCNPSGHGCAFLSRQIRACQHQGTKVLLSIGGEFYEDYTLDSPEEAKGLADYLWHNFLGGNSSSRPLGNAILDGVDFDLEGGTNQYWDVLVTELSKYSSESRKVYLSAAPRCRIPDEYLDSAIRTGLFDHVWVKFFDNPSCQYTTNADRLLASWSKWESYPGVSKLSMGLPAFLDASPGGGYVTNAQFTVDVLPRIESSPKYGGVMLWSKIYNMTIKPYSPKVEASTSN